MFGYLEVPCEMIMKKQYYLHKLLLIYVSVPISTDSVCWIELKSVHFKKPVTRFSFLSKSVVTFNIITTNMTTIFARNEDRVTGFLKWTDFSL